MQKLVSHCLQKISVTCFVVGGGFVEISGNNRLIESGGANNTIVAAIKSEYGVNFTSAQVKQFREDRVQAILSLTENEVLPRSAAERLRPM